VTALINGCLNVMRYLKMLQGNRNREQWAGIRFGHQGGSCQLERWGIRAV
jgi:hypothetical protein